MAKGCLSSHPLPGLNTHIGSILPSTAAGSQTCLLHVSQEHNFTKKMLCSTCCAARGFDKSREKLNTLTLLAFSFCKQTPSNQRPGCMEYTTEKNKSAYRHEVFCSSHTCYLNVTLFIKKNAIKQKRNIHSLARQRVKVKNMNKRCLSQVKRYWRFKYSGKQKPLVDSMAPERKLNVKGLSNLMSEACTAWGSFMRSLLLAP